VRSSRLAIRALVIGALAIGPGGCAARKAFLPPPLTGRTPATPVDLTAITQRCSELSSLASEAALSGRVGGRRVRGQLHLGVARGRGIRLEGIAPFGAPIFTLAGTVERATLVLPRDSRVVADTPPAELIEALAGVALTPDDLLALLVGCLGLHDRTAPAADAFQDVGHGLVWVSTPETRTEIWLNVTGAEPRVIAVRRGDLLVDYAQPPGADGDTPQFRLVAGGGAKADLTLRMSQFEPKADLPDAAWRVDAPAGATPMTLDELRSAGPLGAR
jgi:hypothetical protein